MDAETKPAERLKDFADGIVVSNIMPKRPLMIGLIHIDFLAASSATDWHVPDIDVSTLVACGPYGTSPASQNLVGQLQPIRLWSRHNPSRPRSDSPPPRG
jgi:hypothetical protein